MFTKNLLFTGLTLCLLLQLCACVNPSLWPEKELKPTRLADKLFFTPHVQIQHASQVMVPPEWKHAFEGFNSKSLNSLISNKRVRVTFALHNSNEEVLNSKFNSISDPDHADFRKFMTMEQVASLTSPHVSHKSLVKEYVQSMPDAKIIDISAHENFVIVELSLSSINKYFKASMAPFMHQDGKKVIYRSVEGFAIPQQLAMAVKTIFGIHNFPTTQHKLRVESNGRASDELTTPQSLYKRYNVTTPSYTSNKNLQAIASFISQYVSFDDLAIFQRRYGLPLMKPSVNGPNDPKEPGLEAALDIQYIMAMGYLVNTTINSTPDPDASDDTFLTWAINQQKLGDKSALVHSVSYGSVEKYVPSDLRNSLDDEFKKIGVTGRTILISSGDNGARCNSMGTKFEPEWPTSSPYVTSVGATTPDSTFFEVAVNWGGGGFSKAYARPAYQADAVSQYLRQPDVPDHSYFNVNGRAYPDISALGVGYQVVKFGQFVTVGGTSASTPTVGGMVSLLNDLRLKAGKGPLGFLNPWLYKVVLRTKGSVYDIVKGDDAVAPCPGFEATTGFDPISGVGVPNFRVLSQLALSSP